MSKRCQDPFSGAFGSLESFVDRVSEVLQCHVTLEDAHHQLLAYSRHNGGETDSARVETIIRRRVPEKVIYRLWKDGIIPELLRSRKPVMVEERPDIGLRGRVAISIWKGDEVLGFIWALEGEVRLEPDNLKWLEKAASAAPSLLSRHQRNQRFGNEDAQEIFWKMLTGHPLELKTPLPAQSAVAVFRLTGPLTENLEHKAAYFLNTSEKVRVPFYTTEGHDLIVLAGCEEGARRPHEVLRDFIHTYLKNLTEHLGIPSLDAGYGGIYGHSKDVARSFKEAKMVLDVHNKFPEETQHLLGFQELGIYQLLDTLLDKRMEDGFANPMIDKLIEYDRHHNTQLVETLEAYLDENEHLQRTADKLHIHVNTLSYRLKRITEMTDLNLSNINLKFMVYLDLKLLRWRSEAIIA